MPKTLLSRALLAALVSIIPAQTQSQAKAGAASSIARRAIAGPADMIVVNGRVYTVDDSRPMVSAFAVKNGRILFAGSDREVRALAGLRTRVMDVGGATVIPGMVDAHAHLTGLGASLANVNVAGSQTYEEVIARVVARSKDVKPGEWIFGRGWDQNRWPDKQFPTHEALTRAFPNNPVVLTRIDGHAILANAMAMRAAKITAATPDPSGGRVLRLSDNSPSGVFVDNAEDLVTRAAPPSNREQTTKRILAAIAEANRWGLVGIHDAGEPRSVIEIYESLAKQGKYNLRNYVLISDDSADIVHYAAMGPRSDLYDGRIWVRSIKLYADGALGSRGAAMLAPYSDDPGNTGLLVSAPAHIERVAEYALRKGFQVGSHAIGDRGNRIVLDAYEQALKAVPTADHRFRVEHAQVISPADIPRFAALGVIPSMQASHQTSDMRWAETRVGPDRIKGAYAWRSLLNTGVIIPDGSDFPVEEVNPLISFHAAVARQDETNWPQGGWYADQAMTRAEALKAMTIWPAYAAFQEKIMGSITPGKYADFVVLDQDIMSVPASDILKTNVTSTWIGGKAVYRAPRR
ncbi:MAG TPA: amidohydrolase [Gemmatimonadaceae bacterium]|nr:amidohydrolase [Gemmatimonadaceae bacterium]